MWRLFRALVCVSALAALITPVTVAQARSAAEPASCRVTATRPVATAASIRARGTRTGCAKRATVKIEIRWAGPRPDKIVGEAKKIVLNGGISTSARCTTGPRAYYAIVTDSKGNVARSRTARLRCAPAKPKTTGTSTSRTAEEEVVRLTNEARRDNGCHPLVPDSRLHAAALAHSKDMAAKDYFESHSPDGGDLGDRLKVAHFSPVHSWGENLATGQPTPSAVVNAWLNSPQSRANVVNCAFTHTGVGRARRSGRVYWTQDFAAH
jgi:uncharacterized protein YkwD